MDFKDKVVVITGATGGIGSETAKEFAKRGAKLTLVGRKPELLEKLRTELALDKEHTLFIAIDVRSEEQVKYYVDKTIEKFGRIDIFVNNAGVEGEVAPIVQTEAKNLDSVLDVNVKGVYFGLKHVLPVMYAQKNGSVVMTSSVAGFMGSPGLAPYIASKHAVIGIMKTAALESAEYNVRVNAVCPGPVDNNMMRNIERKAQPDSPEAVKEAQKEAIPFGKYATNLDIANMILFLASDKSKYITGTANRVDGGMGAK